jgi:hypothetical protein
MKFLLAVVMVLAATVSGVVESRAQTSPVMPSGMGATSPVGTGPGGLAFDPQAAALPYSATATQAPCSTPNRNTVPLPTFDGGGMNLTTNTPISDAVGDVFGFRSPGAYGVGTSTSAPCSSVSSSGVVSSPSSVTETPTAGNASSPSLSSTNSPTSTPDAAGVGLAGLGTGGLGTAGLGTAGLGSSPVGASSQVRPPSTGLGGSPTFCSGASAGSSVTSGNTVAGTSMGMSGGTSSASAVTTPSAGADAGGMVRNPAGGVGSGPYDPAQALAGAASVATTNAVGAPCISGE